MIQLIKNLSPLVGCKVDSYKWCPSTAYQVCKDLRLASLICLDVSNDKYYKSGIKYKFENKITISTYNIHKKVMEMDESILDTSYFIQNQAFKTLPSDVKTTLSINDMLFFYAINKYKNDSAIIDCLETLHSIKQVELYNYILFIILDSYSLRYELYKHYILGLEIDYGELRQERLGRLINNVYYLKDKLESYDLNKTTDLNNHLTTLLTNLLLIKKKLKNEFIEVGEIWEDL